MTVRDARFQDIPAIVGVMGRAHQRSVYAHCTFDVIQAKQLLVRCIQRHGHQYYNGALVLVSESRGAVRGFIIGLLDSVYPCLQELRATDLLFIMEEDADPRDASRMVKNVIAWARECPKVMEVDLAITSAIGPWERTAKLYRRIGLEQYGGIFRLVIDRSEQQEVRRVGAH